jgi:hypothetical protein
VLAWAACIGAAHAQTSACAPTDLPCVMREYERICFDDAWNLRQDSCLSWLEAIARSPSTDVRSAAAGAYGLLADNPESAPELRPLLRDRSAELVRGVLAEDPNHVDALLGLANLAPTPEERVSRLRRVVEADPTVVMHLESLARALGDTDPDNVEAVELYDRAYTLAVTRAKGHYAWRFARNALWGYERAGMPDRAARLRERVAEDFGLAALQLEAQRAETTDAERLDHALSEICSEMALNLFGARPCLASIDHVVAAADAAREANERRRLARSASDAMFLAAQRGFRLEAVDREWRGKFEAVLERYFGSAAATRMHEALSIVTIE